MGETRHVEYGVSEGDQRSPQPKGGDADRGVHRDDADGGCNHRVEVAAIHHVDAGLDTDGGGHARHACRPARPAIVERMDLEQEARVGGGVAGEGREDPGHRIVQKRERAVGADLEVGGELQRHQEGRPRIAGKALQDRRGAAGRPLLGGELGDPAGVFDGGMVELVGPVVREGDGIAEDVGKVPGDVPGGILQEAAAVHGVEVGVGATLRHAADRLGIARKAREGREAVRLDGDPVRAQVAVLDGMNADAGRVRCFDRDGLVGARIAEKDEIGDALRGEIGGDEGGPVLEAAAVAVGSRQAPEQTVAKTEIDAADAVATGQDRAGHTGHEGRRRSLEEQHGPQGMTRHEPRLDLRERWRARLRLAITLIAESQPRRH